jgi:hypothetical protein
MNDDQKKALFDVYYLCRFNREAALALGARAERGDGAAAALVVLSLVGSLIAGGLTFAGSALLQPVWAGLNIAATGFGIWALFRSFSRRQFEHYDLARRFEALMLRVETYSGYAARVSGVSSDQIDQKALELRNEYAALMHDTGSDHKRYSDKHEQAIQHRLNEALRNARLL